MTVSIKQNIQISQDNQWTFNISVDNPKLIQAIQLKSLLQLKCFKQLPKQIILELNIILKKTFTSVYENTVYLIRNQYRISNN